MLLINALCKISKFNNTFCMHIAIIQMHACTDDICPFVINKYIERQIDNWYAIVYMRKNEAVTY